MAKKKGASWGKVLLIAVGSLILAGAVFVTVCIVLAQQDNIKDKYTLTQTDDTFRWSALKAALKGSAFNATETQINTYLYQTFCGEDKVLKHVRVYFHQEKSCEIYAKLHYPKGDFALSARAETTFNSTEGIVGVRFHDVKLGELPIPSFIVSAILSDFAKKYDLTTFSDEVLYVRTRYEYDFGDFAFHLRLEEFSPQEGTLLCRTNSLSRELLMALKDYLLSDSGQELFTRLFGKTTNYLKNFVLRTFF